MTAPASKARSAQRPPRRWPHPNTDATYGEEFKREMVRLIVHRRATMLHISEVLHIHRNTLSKWTAKYRREMMQEGPEPNYAVLPRAVREILEGHIPPPPPPSNPERPQPRPGRRVGFAPTEPTPTKTSKRQAQVEPAPPPDDPQQAQDATQDAAQEGGQDGGWFLAATKEQLRAMVRHQVREQISALFSKKGGGILATRRAANLIAGDIIAQSAPMAALVMTQRLADLMAQYERGTLDAFGVEEMVKLSNTILTRSLGQPKLPLEAVHVEEPSKKDLSHLSDEAITTLLTTLDPGGGTALHIEGARLVAEPVAHPGVIDMEKA